MWCPTKYTWCPTKLWHWFHSFQSLYYTSQFFHSLTLCRRHTTCYISQNLFVVITVLQSSISLIPSWMSSNYLTLNPSKTDFLLISLPLQTSKIMNPSLTLPTAQTILPTPSANTYRLHLWLFTLSLSFSKQISSLLSSCHYHIRDIRRIRPIIDFNTASTIATSPVHSRLGYCNSLYQSLPVSQLKRLQQIQNSLPHAVASTHKHSHITTGLESLH